MSERDKNDDPRATRGVAMGGHRFRRLELPGISGRDLGDEYLFYDATHDRVHILNGTARRILLMCDGRRSIEEIATAISHEYSIDTDHALEDAREAVDRLVALGLLEAA